MSNTQAHHEATNRDYRKFGILVGLILAGIFGFLIPYIKRNEVNVWLLGIGLTLFVAGLVFPAILKYPYILWMRIGELLGWINTRIILGIIFYVLITPIGLLKKIFGTDSMRRKLSKELVTYRVPSEVRNPKDMEKPF